MGEMCRAGDKGRGAELPCLLGYTTLPANSMCALAQKLREPHHSGGLWRFRFIGVSD